MGIGVFVEENATTLSRPVEVTSGIPFVVGTAPIHLLDDPESAVNVPVLCRTLLDAMSALGYSRDDMETFTLCQSMYWQFEEFSVAPVIFVNVLNPKTHSEDVTETECTVTQKQAVLNTKYVLKNSLTVKKGDDEEGTELVQGTDYVAAHDDAGNLVITLIDGGKGDKATKLKVSGKALKPEKVSESDIIGGYDKESGKESGLQLIRRVYPMFGITAATIIAPGYSHKPAVGAVMQALCEGINGALRAETVLDLPTDSCKSYEDAEKEKEKAGYHNKHAYPVWPMVRRAGYILWASGNVAALTQASDYSNGGIPNLSPSNQAAHIDGAVLADGTDVYMDMEQAESVIMAGIGTYINMNGWRLKGNYSAAYPESTDPKDMFWCNRRFFSWHGNSFIVRNLPRLDRPANSKLIDSILDEENIRCNGYVAAGACAAASIEIDSDRNTTETLANGTLYFRQRLTPFPPAQEIINTLEYDPEALMTALNGGEA